MTAIRFLIQHALVASCMYAGFVLSIEWAKNISIFYFWGLVLISAIMSVMLFFIIAKGEAVHFTKALENEKKSPKWAKKLSPYILLIYTIALALNGYIFLSLLYFVCGFFLIVMHRVLIEEAEKCQ